MPYVKSGEARVHWRSDGENGPTILLLNSLGTDLGMWDEVAAILMKDFRVLRFDMRGHGATRATAGDYTMDMLAQDAEAVLDAAGVRGAAVCGLSLGALVAVHMAKREPNRVRALALANIATAFNPPDWKARAVTVRTAGMAPLVEPSLTRFLSDGFRASFPERTSAVRDALERAEPEGYAGCCMAIATTPTLPTDPHVATFPLLSIGGSLDAASPPLHAEAIAKAGGGRLAIFEAAHLSAIEDPAGFSREMRALLSSTDPESADGNLD